MPTDFKYQKDKENFHRAYKKREEKVLVKLCVKKNKNYKKKKWSFIIINTKIVQNTDEKLSELLILE